jgi:hypothetical protein
MIRIRVLSTLILYLVVYFTVLTLPYAVVPIDVVGTYFTEAIGYLGVFQFLIFGFSGHGARHTAHGTARHGLLLSSRTRYW